MTTIVFKGKSYTLTTDADFTNRTMPVNDYNDPDEDGNYTFEMSAQAVDTDGTGYTVYWIFTTSVDIVELDEYDYDNIDRIEEN